MTSAPVTDWPERLALTGLFIALFLASLLGMRAGWRRRAASQSDITAPPESLSSHSDVFATAEGTFVGTSRATDWLDRIVVHDLGVPSRATIEIGTDGVQFLRDGARDLAIAREHLLAARVDRAVGADVVDAAVVLTWQWHSDRLDTGFRPREGSAMPQLMAALGRITEVTS